MRSVLVPAFAAILTVAVAPLDAQVGRDDLTPMEIRYLTRIGEDMSKVQVTIEIDRISRPRLHLAMPNWTPGAYGIGRYGDRVDGIAATGAGDAALELVRMDHQTWSLDTAGQSRVSVSYSMPVGRRRRGGGDPAKVTGLRVSGPSTYLYVVGAKQLPVESLYEVPDGWGVANGLAWDDDPTRRVAKDYDTFIDAPTIFGVYKETEFEVNGTRFICVFFNNEQQYDFDMEAKTEVCRKIVTYQGELFGSFPFGHYVFLFTLPGGGGLEHLNSTTIGLSPNSMKRDPASGAFVTAHEFFHAWNVKRIRPQVLGPFEYQHENYTGNLWVAEGWTSYYGDLTLVRTGILDRDAFLKKIEGIAYRELNKESRKQHSVYWASRNVWHRDRDAPPRVDYYGTGQLLGNMIDLKIRHETDNRKSLDDVVVFLNRWFAEQDAGFEEGDVERACTAISNHDFREFFARHVYGTIDPPMAEYLAYAGVGYEEKRAPSGFPFSYRVTGDTLRVSGPAQGVDEEAAVLKRNDVVQSFDGEKADTVFQFLEDKAPGETVKVVFKRGEEEQEAEVTLIAPTTMRPAVRFMKDADERQLRIRESWLSGK